MTCKWHILNEIVRYTSIHFMSPFLLLTPSSPFLLFLGNILSLLLQTFNIYYGLSLFNFFSISPFLTDIQEFYELTLLDDSKTIQQKTVETLQIASKWEHENSIKNNSDVSNQIWQNYKKSMSKWHII